MTNKKYINNPTNPVEGIIRCKDCIYGTIAGNTGLICTRLNELTVKDEFFCAFGTDRIREPKERERAEER